MRYVSFLIYGDKHEYQLEFALSVLSALHFLRGDTRGVRLSVLSDRPHLEFDLPVEHVPVSSEDLAAWTRNGAYHHRAKLHALIRLLDVHSSPVALIDTDTVFLAHPARLFDDSDPSGAAMHAAEGVLSDHPEWCSVLDQIGTGREIEGVRIAPDSRMYNSGVVVLWPEHRPLVLRALRLLDSLYAIAPIFNADQFSLSAVLEAEATISLTEAVVKHYWGMERSFVHIGAERLFHGYTRERLPELLRAFPKVSIGFPSKRWRDQLLARVLGQIGGWSDDYRFAYLAYRCAFGIGSRDREYANAWALASLLALTGPPGRAGSVVVCSPAMRRDFSRMDPARRDTPAWLQPEVRSRWKAFWVSDLDFRCRT
jgi:hypothetical protein